MKLTERAKARLRNRASASQEKNIKSSILTTLNKIMAYWKREWKSAPQARVYIASGVALTFMLGSAYVAVNKIDSTKPWTKVFTNGTYVGLVPNNPQVLRTISSIASGYHVELSTEPVCVNVPKSYNWHQVAAIPTTAVAIRVNGEPVVYTTSVKSATSVVTAVQKALTPSGVTPDAQVAFVGHVDTQSAVVSVTRILDEEDASRYLLNPHATLSGRGGARFALASLTKVHQTTLNKKNASLNPLLQVQVTETVSKRTALPYSVRYEKTSQFATGVIKVSKAGKQGVARDVVERKYLNGKLVSQVVVKCTVLRTAVQEVALEGTNSGIAGGSWSWPSADTDVTSPFGWRNMNGWKNFHPGIDIGCPIGTPVYASNNGVVEQAGWNSGGYGNWAFINNGNGIQTVFGHMSHVIVHSGEVVAKGQLIGYSGDTGEATGPHLHYEVRLNGTPISPTPYM